MLLCSAVIARIESIVLNAYALLFFLHDDYVTLCASQGKIAADALAAAIQGHEEVARLQGWAYYQALTRLGTSVAANPDPVAAATATVVKLPTRFFNVLLSTVWRGVDVVSVLGSMADVSVAPDRSTYIALHAALLRLGEIEGAAAALARGVSSGHWKLEEGAGATATLALKQMVMHDEGGRVEQKQRQQQHCHHHEQQQQQQQQQQQSQDVKTVRGHAELRDALSRQPVVDAVPNTVASTGNGAHEYVSQSTTVDDLLPLKQPEEPQRHSHGLLDLDRISTSDRGELPDLVHQSTAVVACPSIVLAHFGICFRSIDHALLQCRPP